MAWPFKKATNYEKLDPSSGKKKSLDEGYPTSILETRRISPVKLENMFATEPILGAGCATWQSLIADTGFEVTSPDERVQQEINDILKYTTLYDEYTLFAPLHLCIFGNFWLEHIRGKDEKIVEFLAVDPKLMDFERQDKYSDVVKVDKLGRPAKFMMSTSSGDVKYFVPNTEMSHRAYLQVTHTQLGLGMIEQVYRDSELKENLEQARTQAAYNLAWPKPLIGYGSEVFNPTAEMKKRAEALAMDIADANKAWVTYPKTQFSIEFQESAEMKDEIVNQLLYTTKLQAAVLGIPFALLLQTGIGEGRATMETLIDFFEYRFKGFQKKLRPEDTIMETIKNNQPALASKDPQIDIEYGKLSHKASKEFVMNIQRLAKTEMIDPNDPEIKELVRKALGIKAIKKINRVAEQEMIAYGRILDEKV